MCTASASDEYMPFFPSFPATLRLCTCRPFLSLPPRSLTLARPLLASHAHDFLLSLPIALPGVGRHHESLALGVGLAVLRPDHGAHPHHPGHALHGVRGGVLGAGDGGVPRRQAGRPGAVVFDAGLVSTTERQRSRRKRGGRSSGRGVRAVGWKRPGHADHVGVGEDGRQRMVKGRWAACS